MLFVASLLHELYSRYGNKSLFIQKKEILLLKNNDF